MARRAARLLARLPATLSLCAATLAAFLLEVALGGPSDLAAQVRLGALEPARVSEAHEAFRLLMPALLHVGWLHLVLVELALLQLGALVETMWGGRRTLVVWVWSAVAGSLASVLASELPNPTSVGGSAAAMGLAGLLLGTTWFGPEPARTFLAEAVGRRVSRVVALTFLLGLGAWLLYPITDNWAHLGGFACGVLLSVALEPSTDGSGSAPEAEGRGFVGPVFAATAALVVALVGWTAVAGGDALPTLDLDAARSLAVVLSEDPEAWNAPSLTLEMLEHDARAGALDEGLDAVTREVRRAHDPAVVGSVATVLAQASEEDGRPFGRHAMVAIERWLALSPTEPDVLNLAAWHLLTRDDAEHRDPVRAERLARDALARLAAVADDDQPTARAAYLDTLAEALYQQGRLEEAAEAQRESVALAKQLELATLDDMTARLDRIQKALGSG